LNAPAGHVLRGRAAHFGGPAFVQELLDTNRGRSGRRRRSRRLAGVRNPKLAGSIKETGENKFYLPGIKLSKRIRPGSSFEEVLDGVTLVVCAVPSHGVRQVFVEARNFIHEDSVIVSAAKGIEEQTLLTPSGIIRDVLKKYAGVVALSGPSFAKEVAARLPAAVSAASVSPEAAMVAQETFSTPYFRVYTNPDIIGVELGGALKNIIAIASGASDGLRLGHNARAALITRGLAEISRLGVKLGADPSTFPGLSGLGDLVLTCTGALSRNYTVGLKIGEGKKLTDVLGGMNMVAEGVRTSKAARELARTNGVEMPIIEAVYDVLYRGKPPEEAVYDLMTRGLKGE